MKENQPIAFLEGGGEMGQLVRNYDWEKTKLGRPENWPLSLQTTVGIILHSAFPMFLFWGEELLCFYNDPYRPSLGIDGKHPLIGKSGKEAWPDIWDFIGPLIEKVMTTGEAVWFKNQFLPIYRNGTMEDVYWTFSYSPAYGDRGEIAGVFVTCTETTQEVLTQKELAESRQQLIFAIDATELGTWELNPATNKFKGNARLKEWFGLEPDEEIDLSLATTVIVEEDRARVLDAIAKALTFASGGHYEIEYTIRNPHTGKETIVKAKGQAKFDEQQQPYIFSGTLQDVTSEALVRKQLSVELNEQKLIRKKIEESEAHLQLLRNAVPAVIFYLNAELRYQSYNGAFMEWFQVDATAAIGKTVHEFMGEVAYARAEPYLMRALAGESVRYEVPAPSRMNQQGWLSIGYTPHFGNEGKVIGIIVHATDITQSKQTELSLRNSELFSHNVFYNSPVAKIVYTGEDMIIERVNENMLGLLGRDDSIIGKPFLEVLPELLNTPLMERMQHVYKTGETFIMPEEQIKLVRFGKLFTGYYSYIYKPLFSSAGEIYGIMATATEITEQVLARQQIEAKEKELRELIEASPIGICILSGNPVRAEEVNERFLKIWDKTREQFNQAPYWEVLQEIAFRFEPIMARVFATGERLTTEEQEIVLMRGGALERIFVTFEYIPVLDAAYEVIKVILIAIEVTQQVATRKQIEEAVVNRTKELAESNLSLRRSNEELEQFAYIASHDLQEPIRKISTFTQMLEHSLQNPSEKSKDYIAKIYNSTDRMTKLVRDVLAFSRVKGEKHNFEQVDLKKIMESVQADFEVQIESTHATLEISGLPTIEAIPTQMTQLFSNLLSNSLKYKKEHVKPIIKISTSIATAEKVAKRMVLDGRKKYYHIQFSDNGIGFHEEYVDRIFKIFQRLHGKNEFEGTGIGLAICLKIVQNHQGHISATGRAGGGAVFNILLPEIQDRTTNDRLKQIQTAS